MVPASFGRPVSRSDIRGYMWDQFQSDADFVLADIRSQHSLWYSRAA